MSSLLDSSSIDARESDVRTSLNSLIDSLRSYKNELLRQERKLQETRSLMLDQLTDSNAATVIRNLTKRLEDREAELTRSQHHSAELEEKSRSDEGELKAKSRHIEKLSSLLLVKEERIQGLEEKVSKLEGRVGGFEVMVEARNETCEKWRNAAHEAAEKMREQLNTLKASEEMNHELKCLLDKQLLNDTGNLSERGTIASSDVLTEEELQELVTSFSTPLTTAVTCSVGRKASSLNRSGSFSFRNVTPKSESGSPSLASRTFVTPQPSSSSSSLSHGMRTLSPVTRAESPLLRTVVRVTRPESPRSRSTTPVSLLSGVAPSLNESLTSFAAETVVVEEVVVQTMTRNEHGSYAGTGGSPLVASEMEGDESQHVPRVRFHLDDSSESPSSLHLYKPNIPYPAPVPNYSALVTDALERGRIHDPVLWKYFIRECVHFYYDLLPLSDSLARNSYYNIGRTLFEKYPIIAKEGPNFKTPWTYFNTCLSSRLRNERFTKRRQNEKRGYILPAETEEAPDSKRGRLDPSPSSSSWREGCHL